RGWYRLIRGQFLLMVDLRSRCILSFALLPEKSYNSQAIRTLITKAALEHGLPRKGFYFENGLWRTSKLIKGSQSPAPFSEFELGQTEFGLRFIHARL